VFPNDSLVSLLQVACIKTCKTWVLHSFAVSVARDQRSVIVFDCAGAPRLCEREEGVDWRIARRAYKHWDQQEAEGAHGPGRNLSKASRATICCPCWYTRSFMCILVSSDLSKLWTKGTKSSEVTSVASMLWRGHFLVRRHVVTCFSLFCVAPVHSWFWDSPLLVNIDWKSTISSLNGLRKFRWKWPLQ
jgi:hypothetical protein